MRMYCVVPENNHTPHGRDLTFDMPSPLDFPKSAHKMDPPPLQKFHFCRTPSGNTIIPCGNQKLAIFLAQNAKF